MADQQITVTHTTKHPDGSTTIYGYTDDGQHISHRFPPGAKVIRLNCTTCATPLVGEMCPSCVTPEQITGG